MEEDIDVVRNHLGEVMVELEGWGPRATGVPARLRQNAKPLALGTLALVAAGLGLYWARSNARKGVVQRALALLPTSLPSRNQSRQLAKRVLAKGVLAKRVKEGLSLATRRREPPHHPVRSLLYKISSAGLVAAASVIARHVATRLVQRQSTTASTNPNNNLAANFGR
ncbi:MAG TPA: hypothetical protein VHU40_21570 [Polyangia bacterium]|nr:hypothetical protein [Polyangia bacterium]